MPTNPNKIEPTEQPKAGKGGIAALVGVGVAAILVPFVGQWEGKRNDPYRDIVGIWTVCYGDTKNVVPGQRQTDAQCNARLDEQLVNHAKPVIACVPQLKDRPYQLAASISLAYNIGTGGFCKSSAAREFRAGHWVAGCTNFLKWNKAGGKVVPGLARRREAERKICMTGLV